MSESGPGVGIAGGGGVAVVEAAAGAAWPFLLARTVLRLTSEWGA